MGEFTDAEARYVSLLPLFDAKWVKTCAFGAEFQAAWKRVLRNAARNEQDYSPGSPYAVYALTHNFEQVTATFHFDQLKLAAWFEEDARRRERRVFLPQEVTRTLEGELTFHDSSFSYDATAVEPCVAADGKEILACSLPGFPPPLRVVYGNGRVEGGFRGFKGRKLPIYLIQPEFTPAFLCSSFELCLYLFWMDCCIMMGNRGRVSDKNVKPLLHIFRESSMLTVKGLL